jgi:hypothetical protein
MWSQALQTYRYLREKVTAASSSSRNAPAAPTPLAI